MRGLFSTATVAAALISVVTAVAQDGGRFRPPLFSSPPPPLPAPVIDALKRYLRHRGAGGQGPRREHHRAAGDQRSEPDNPGSPRLSKLSRKPGHRSKGIEV